MGAFVNDRTFHVYHAGGAPRVNFDMESVVRLPLDISVADIALLYTNLIVIDEDAGQAALEIPLIEAVEDAGKVGMDFSSLADMELLSTGGGLELVERDNLVFIVVEHHAWHDWAGP